MLITMNYLKFGGKNTGKTESRSFIMQKENIPLKKRKYPFLLIQNLNLKII